MLSKVKKMNYADPRSNELIKSDDENSETVEN